MSLKLTATLIGAVLLVPACKGGDSARIDPAALTAVAPLPAAMETAANPLAAAKVDLGRTLYYDTRLSLNNNVSCNSCHSLTGYGVDGRQFSLGTKNQPGGRNAPTVYNAAAHIAQFWDGRAPTVEEQAKGPVLNPVEMGMPNATLVLSRLRAVSAYRVAFKNAFPGQANPITYDNVGLAIGAFERGLVTPGPWDRFLKGDSTALTPEQRRGFNAFVSAGCQACHAGALVGGAMYQKLGMVRPWTDKSDVGRAAVTHQASDTLVFKVPSLRNVTQTGPWFHNGSVATLPQAVRLMGQHQLGRDLTDQQVAEIVDFLQALKGDLPTSYIAQRTN